MEELERRDASLADGCRFPLTELGANVHSEFLSVPVGNLAVDVEARAYGPQV